MTRVLSLSCAGRRCFVGKSLNLTLRISVFYHVAGLAILPKMRFLLLLLCAPCLVLGADPNTAPSPDKVRQLFAWFDRLPLTDVSKLQHIRIWTGGYSETLGKRQWATEDGFLIKDDGNEFEAVLEDWTVTSFTKSGTQPETDDFVGYRQISLTNEIQKMLAKLGTKDEADAWDYRQDSYYDRMGRTGQLFALARICAKRGQTKLSRQILDKLPAWRRIMPNSHADEPLEIELQDEFATLLAWQTIRSFSNRDATRSSVLARLRQIVELCPTADFELKRVRQMIAVLEKMIREDAEHRAISDENFASLSPELQAEELIFRLRDESVETLDEWPFQDVIQPYPSNGSLAALKALGFAAAPALIKALDEDSLSRSVISSHRYGGGVSVSAVHELAINALNEMAGFNFYWQVPNSGPIGRQELEKAVRKEVAQWWQTVSQEGELHYLTKQMQSAAASPEDCASRLLAKYPDDAILPIVDCARNTKSARNRTALTRVLWRQKDPRCTAFFESELTNGPALENRVAAAYGLRLLKDPRAFSAMRVEWEKLIADPKSLSPTLDLPLTLDSPAEASDNSNSPKHLIGFLASSAAPEAALILEKNRNTLPIAWQQAIIEQLASNLIGPMAEGAEPPTAGTRATVEDVLIDFLDDKTRLPEENSISSNEPLIHPRLCDFAAIALRNLWPDRYHFAIGLPPKDRDRACVVCKNVRRADLGEPLHPLPAEAPSPAKPLRNRNEIVSTEWAEDSMAASRQLSSRLRTLQGSTLRPEALIKLMTGYAAHPDQAGRGLEVTITRFLGCGVTIQARLLPGTPPGAKSDFSRSDVWGNFGGFGSTGKAFGEHANPERWKGLEQAITAALSAPPDRAYLIGVRLRADN